MKNKEIEELLNKMKNCNGIFDYYLEYGEVDLLLSYIEQLEKKCESLLENKNEALRYISNYLALDQRYKWNDNVDEKLKLVKKFLNGREKTIAGISYEDLLRQNKQLENNRDKAIEYNQEIVDNYLEEDDCEYCDGRYNVAKKNLNILKGGSDDTR